jgi:hypothetical protein
VAKSTVFYKAKAYPEVRKRTARKELEEVAKTNILAITAKKSTYGTPKSESNIKA